LGRETFTKAFFSSGYSSFTCGEGWCLIVTTGTTLPQEDSP